MPQGTLDSLLEYNIKESKEKMSCQMLHLNLGDAQATHATDKKRIQSYSQGFPLATVRCLDDISE